MNRIERRLRDALNPCSTAFTRWWCRSGRYLPLVNRLTGQRRRPVPRRPAGQGGAGPAFHHRSAIVRGTPPLLRSRPSSRR